MASRVDPKKLLPLAISLLIATTLVGWWQIAGRADRKLAGSSATTTVADGATTITSATTTTLTIQTTTSTDVSTILGPTTATTTATAGGPKTTTTPPQGPASPSTLSTLQQTEIPLQAIGPAGGSGAATNLEAASDCDPLAGTSARLTWSVASEAGDDQRVAVSQYADGLERGRFTLSKPLPAGARDMNWTGLEPGVFYRWQVLTRHADQYTPSQTASFRGADCFAGQ